MNLEQKVISLELAKEIKQVAEEKGVELPESERAWLNSHPGGWHTIRVEDTYLIGGEWKYNTYDVAELGEILPNFVRSERAPNTSGDKEEDIWIITARALETHTQYEKGATEAEARGKMLLYLLKNDLLNKN